MSDGNEIYISHEERDPERLERILRHSSRRQDTPMMLVQLADAPTNPNTQPTNSQLPLRHGPVTIVNMGSAPPVTFEDKIDPFEWYFRRNSPNLRYGHAQEGGVGELTSQRKSRIGANPMEDTNIMVNSQAPMRYAVNVDVPESEDKEQTTRARTQEQPQGRETKSKSKIEETRLQRNNFADNGVNIEREKQFYRLESNDDDPLPALDVIMNRLVNYNEKVTAIPAQYSFTEQKSPFKNEKERDEKSRRPSSRVRVLLMVDEWDEDDGLDDEKRRKQAKGDGRRGRDKYRRGGPQSSEDLISYTPSSSDQPRREYTSSKSPLDGKRKDKPGKGERSDEDGKSIRYKDGEGSERGQKPGYGGDIGDEGGRGIGGRRPGERGYDNRQYGGQRRQDGSVGGLSDEDMDKRDRKGKYTNKWGNQPGDQHYDQRQKRDWPRSGDRSDGLSGDEDGDKRGRGEKGKDKRGRRPGDRDYGDRKYGDESRSADRSDGGFYDDNRDRKSRRGRDKRGKDKPGSDQYDSKYRLVTIPKPTTTLITRRRYHLQVTDHNMKEPWFNSRFNISKENNVDFNYEGPVKITPYYVADKFT